MKLLKIFIGTIIALILLFIVGAIILVTLVDPNDFKSKITEVVHQKTGRDLEIGKISWSFFPWLGLKVNDVSFNNSADFKEQDFIKIGEIGLRTEFLAIFKGQIRIGTLILKNADIKLIKNQAGKTNWQDLTTPENSSAGKPNSSKIKNSKIALISISNINISNANISWDDAQTGQKVNLRGFNFYCQEIEFDPNVNELGNKLKLRGNLNIDQFTANKLYINNIKTDIGFEKGMLTLNPLRATFYDGKLDGNVTINLKDKFPSFALEQSLEGLKLEPLLKDLINVNNLSGIANININATTFGLDSKAILKNLNGQADINIVAGALKGVDINAIIAKAETLLQRTTFFGRDTGMTKFDSLTGKFFIHNGIITNNDLVLKAKKFQLLGQGTINLVTTQVNYQVKVVETSNKANQILVPINITGTFDNLSYEPDFSNFLGSTVKLLKNVIKNTATTTTEPIKKLGRSIGSILPH